MNWKAVEERRLNIEEGYEEGWRDFYRDLLLACYPYVPPVDAHGIDQRAIEEALRGDV